MAENEMDTEEKTTKKRRKEGRGEGVLMQG